MLQDAYFLAKISADTAENEQHLAEILPKTGNYPTGAARAYRDFTGSPCAWYHANDPDCEQAPSLSRQ